MNQLIAGEVILGGSIGTVSVAYAGELNENDLAQVRSDRAL